MTSEHLRHDPERCATCSGKRHRDEPNPLADSLRKLLERLSSVARRGSQEGP